MVKRKEKKVKSKSQKQSQKKGSQKQSQSVSVNVNLGKRGGRSKTTPITKISPPFPFNFPPFFNPYNQQPNNFLIPPPPIPQKQYATFPEGETAAALGILPTVPIPLKFQTTLKEAEPEPNLAKAKKTEEVQLFAPKVDEEPVFTSGIVEEEQPPFFNEPPTTTPMEGEAEANVEPLLTPAEEESYKQLTSQYRAAELPVEQTYNIPSLKELAEKKAILPVGSLKENVAYSPFQLYPAPEQLPEKKIELLPVEPPSPSGSSISGITYVSEEPLLLGVPSSSFYNVGGLSLPPLNLAPRQQIKGAEEILTSFAKYIKPKPQKNEPVYEEPAFFFSEGLTGRTLGEYSAPLVPPVAEEKPKKSKSKSKKMNITETPEEYESKLNAFMMGNLPEETFLLNKPPLAISGGIERKRGGAAIPAAEEDLLLKQSNIPPLFTQRSQTTL